ncbi:MAG TPA: hypothetical protein P5228_04005 [Bacteroidales bacterium]|nr:hypothetical protein [Bacteroidales bacterium]HRZ48418.1 hypothetical protein [Bacteroidales bacterium]
MGIIKDILKSRLAYFRMKGKMTPLLGVQQLQLFHYYRDKATSGDLPGLDQTGFRVFSQFEEDGLLLYILSIIGMETRRFVEIGSDDGLNSNCANLYFHFGYHGLFIDGNPRSIRRGERFYNRYPNRWHYKPRFVCAMVKRENVNQLIEKEGFSGWIDLLSVDIDGNDYWIWDALEACTPRVVIIETHVEFGLQNIVVPYDPDYCYPGKHPVYHGASAMAMYRLGKKKGYRLVGANRYGSNFIFVKEELCGNLLPEVTPESLLTHPSAVASFADFNLVNHLPYEQG